jgi:hypothetical protein
MLLHECIVHERDARGVIQRQYQTISLVDVTRIREGRVRVVEVRLGGEWLEIESNLDDFRLLWERAKVARFGEH